MPVTATAQGKKFTFPDGTTPEQMGQAIDEFFAAQQSAPEPPPERTLISDSIAGLKGAAQDALGVGENIASVASSIALEPIAGLAGLGAAAFGDEGAAADTVRAVQGLAFQPRSERGQEMQQALGEGISAAGEAITENITKPLGINDLGGRTFEATGSPELATIVDIMPELAMELGPAALVGGKVIKNSRKARKVLADQIKAGNVNAGNIAKAVDVDGSLIKNPNVKKAIKLMGDEDAAYSTAINFEKMDDATRKQINKMLDVIEANKRSGDPLDIMRNRPANVIGESIADRVNKLDKIKRNASANIGKLMKGETGKRQVNITQARDDFFQALQEADIDIGADKGKLVSDPSRTLTNVEEVIGNKKLDNVLNRINEGSMGAADAHKMKRQLREMVSFDAAAPGATKVSAEIEAAVKKLSSDLGSSISQISPAYAKSNQVFSETIDALQKADKALGNQLMIGDKLAESKFAALSKRIGTNLASRESVIDLVDSLDTSLAKRGVKSGDDVQRQVAALADLEKIFKVESAQSPFGFQARVAQGVVEGSPTNAALGAALDKFRSMTALEFDDKMRALRELSRVRN